MSLPHVAFADPDCRLNMEAIDQLPKSFRPLVYEFGLVIVVAMWNDGYHDARELRGILESRRDRLQREWLATDYVTPAIAENIKSAFLAPRRPGRRIRTRRACR
jgi:hypothetical protein